MTRQEVFKSNLAWRAIDGGKKNACEGIEGADSHRSQYQKEVNIEPGTVVLLVGFCGWLIFSIIDAVYRDTRGEQITPLWLDGYAGDRANAWDNGDVLQQLRHEFFDSFIDLLALLFQRPSATGQNRPGCCQP